jgi:pSer/pThr/pTyr-binding forkhead associated (FHA) protein
MLICGNCQARQYEGTVFCTECGAAIVALGPHNPTTFTLERSATVPPLTDVSSPEAAVAPAVQAALRLTIIGTGRRIELHPAPSLLIGRRDAARGVYPDIDLSGDGGYDAGVSRRHARLLYRHNGYILEDLQSANGTFVNGNRVSPDQPAAVRLGDELGFGSLVVRIELG